MLLQAGVVGERSALPREGKALPYQRLYVVSSCLGGPLCSSLVPPPWVPPRRALPTACSCGCPRTTRGPRRTEGRAQQAVRCLGSAFFLHSSLVPPRRVARHCSFYRMFMLLRLGSRMRSLSRVARETLSHSLGEEAMMDKWKAFFTGKTSALAPCAPALFLGLMVCASLAEVRVTRIEITSRVAVADGMSFGDTGPYEKLQGTGRDG